MSFALNDDEFWSPTSINNQLTQQPLIILALCTTIDETSLKKARQHKEHTMMRHPRHQQARQPQNKNQQQKDNVRATKQKKKAN